MRKLEYSPLKIFTLYWLPTIFIAGAIFFASSISDPPVLINMTGSDKLLHIFAFIPLGFFMHRAVNVYSFERTRFNIILSFILCSIYGFTDEIHQAFVPGRNSDINDIWADLIGSILGIAIFYVVHKLILNRK